MTSRPRTRPENAFVYREGCAARVQKKNREAYPYGQC